MNWNLSSNSFESTTSPLLFAAASVHRDESQPRLIESSQEKIFAGIAGNCRVVPLSRQQIIEIEILAAERNIHGDPSTVASCRAIDRDVTVSRSEIPGLSEVCSFGERVSSSVVGNGRASRQSKPILWAFSTGNTLSSPLGTR